MEFACPSCGEVVEFSPDGVGQAVGCPGCGNISMAPAARLAPSMVVGDFVLKAPLRRSSNFTDFEAHQRSLDRPVSLKILNEDLSANEELAAKFMDTARIAARLEHPNIVTIYEVGRDGDVIYLAREAVEGRDLDQILRAEGKIDPRLAMRFFMEIALALEYAWSAEKLVHGNIKPAVIEINDKGVGKLSELGLTQLMLAAAGDRIAGTPQYISPEMIAGEPLDARSDVYSLGAVLFQALTGDYPFNGATPAEILEGHMQAPLRSLKSLNALIPDALEDIVCKMLAKRPEDRYQTPSELANALNALNQGDTRSQLMRRQIRAAAPPPVAAPVQPPPSAAAPKEKAKPKPKTTGTGFHPRRKSKTFKTGTEGGRRTKVRMKGADSHGPMSVAAASQQMAAQPAPAPRAVPTGLIVGAVLVLVVIVGALVFYARCIPGDKGDLIRIYLRGASVEERHAYGQVRSYLGQADFYKTNLAELETAAGQMHQFISDYPDSLFSKRHADIRYDQMFGLPDFLVGKHRKLGRYVAGQVAADYARYEEFLARQKRLLLHKDELEHVEAYRRELARQRQEEARQRAKEEAERRIVQAKQERLNGYLSFKDALLKDQFEITRNHQYSQLIAKLRPMLGEAEPMFGEVTDWARRKIATLELASTAYDLVFDSGIKLHGERIHVAMDGKRKRVEVRSFKNNKVQVKYKELVRRKDRKGKLVWLNQSIDRELPFEAIPFKELEVLTKIAMEKAAVQGDFYLLMGTFYYYSGNRAVATRLLKEATDARAELIREELSQLGGG